MTAEEEIGQNDFLARYPPGFSGGSASYASIFGSSHSTRRPTPARTA